jgi:hypothetical protein
MAAFLRDKGQILWDVTVNTAYVHPVNFLALGLRDMFDANNKAVDYLYRALCQSEFDRVQAEDLVCRIWEQLKNAHAGNAQVHARLFATYRIEYKNFTHLPGESIDAMFQRFTVIVNNMKANVVVLPYDDHDRAIKLLHSLDRTVWSEKVEAILDTTPAPPVFPPQTDNFQKPIKFKSDLGNEFFAKKGEKPSEEKPDPKDKAKTKTLPL